MKPKKPTPAQLNVLRRVRDERIACVNFRSYREHATYTSHTIRNAYVALDPENHICGPEIRFDVVLRLETRGWARIDTLDGIGQVVLTDAGRELLEAADAVRP